MRDRRKSQPQFFPTINVNDRIQPDYPLWAIKTTVVAILAEMTAAFAKAWLDKQSLGATAKLTHLGHAITDYRQRPVIAVTPTEANGRGEHAAAVILLDCAKATPA